MRIHKIAKRNLYMKKRFIISLGIVGVLVVVSCCMILSSIKNRYDYENESRMFETIDDLAFIDEYIVEQNINDEDISDANEAYFLESKTVTIEYNGNKINVFAYTFESTEYCIEYANKASGNNYKNLYSGDDISQYYYKHTSFINIVQSEKLLVFSNEKAYVISAKISEKDFNEFIKYFMNHLPTKVKIAY